MPDFANMTAEEAVSYCYKHKKDYLRECEDASDREFDCLISILEDGTIKPTELPSYGMDFI